MNEFIEWLCEDGFGLGVVVVTAVLFVAFLLLMSSLIGLSWRAAYTVWSCPMSQDISTCFDEER